MGGRGRGRRKEGKKMIEKRRNEKKYWMEKVKKGESERDGKEGCTERGF